MSAPPVWPEPATEKTCWSLLELIEPRFAQNEIVKVLLFDELNVLVSLPPDSNRSERVTGSAGVESAVDVDVIKLELKRGIK